MKINTQTDNEINVISIVLKTIFKTIWVVLFSFGFVFMSLNIVAPKLVLDAYDFVGLDKPAYLVQKRLYLRNGTNENLYNLIQRSIEIGNYSDQVEFIVVMLESEDYMQFQEIIDLATKESLGARYSIYADSYDSYLRRHLINALYKTDQNATAKQKAIESIDNSLCELNEYISLVDIDENMSNEQKKLEIVSICSDSDVLLVLETKQLELDESLILLSSSHDKIVIYNQKIKLAETQYRLAKYTNNGELKTWSEEKISEWINEIGDLKQKLN